MEMKSTLQQHYDKNNGRLPVSPIPKEKKQSTPEEIRQYAMKAAKIFSVEQNKKIDLD